MFHKFNLSFVLSMYFNLKKAVLLSAMVVLLL